MSIVCNNVFKYVLIHFVFSILIVTFMLKTGKGMKKGRKVQ
jgi:hypothetical protein